MIAISSDLDQTSWVNKEFPVSMSFGEPCGTQGVILSRQDHVSLRIWVANHSVVFGPSFLLTQLAI